MLNVLNDKKEAMEKITLESGKVFKTIDIMGLSVIFIEFALYKVNLKNH